MAQPTPYNRQFNFANQQALTPSTPLPATQIDAELNAVKLTSDQTLANLAKIQRDDGALKNGIVTQDSLSASLSIGFTYRGVWAEDVNYLQSDGVSIGSLFFRAKVANLSSGANQPPTPPATNEFWELIADITPIAIGADSVYTDALQDEAVTEAKLADGAATEAKIGSKAVTFAKIQDIGASRVMGRVTAGDGPVEEITGEQITALLDVFTGDSGSGGVKGLVPAPGAGEGAAAFLSADGTFKDPIAPGTVINHRPAALATTSGTTKDFSLTGTVKRVRVMLAGVSITTSDRITIQLGAGGVPKTSGYVGSGTLLPHAAAIAVANITNGAALTGSGGASLLWDGWIEFALQNESTNTWSWSGSFGVSGGATLAAGTVSLSGSLDFVRLTMDAGSGTFDAGSVSVEYDTTA